MSKDVILNHNGSTVSDLSAFAEVFNNYFSNVASNLDRNIPHSNIFPLNLLGAPVKNSYFCPPSDRDEIVNIICWQKNKSADLMNIPEFIYKFTWAGMASRAMQAIDNPSYLGLGYINPTKHLLPNFTSLVSLIRVSV